MISTKASLQLVGSNALSLSPKILSHEELVSIGISAGNKAFNEDAVGAVILDGRTVLAVSDGHWGYEASELALLETLNLFRNTHQPSGQEPTGWLYLLFERINRRLLNEALLGDSLRTPETALLVVHIQANGTIHYASFGDCCLYRIPKNGTPSLINQPQQTWLGTLSALSGQVDDGIKTFSGAHYQSVASKLEVGSSVIRPGDILIVASDGLSQCQKRETIHLHPKDLADTIKLAVDVSQKSKLLIEKALNCGGIDNVACCLYQHPPDLRATT